jgi:formamidopyrimidine-DNA glycosylase
MPELPEVETIARKLRPILSERRIQSIEVFWPRTVDRPDLDTFVTALTGARVRDVGRRGKFLLMPLDTGQTLLVHLRMSGRFAVRAGSAIVDGDKHTRARIRLDDGTSVCYVDPRKFGRFYLVDDPREVVGHLGPEPLLPTFTAGWLVEHLANRRGEIKRLLLDQRFIAGLGNIYVSEALWQAGIHPRRIAGSLGADEARKLHAAIVAALRAGVENGGTSLGDRQYVYPDGGLGRHQTQLQVYDRAGERCARCGYTLERIVQGQRSTYFCPVCQK